MGYRKKKFYGWGVIIKGSDFTESFKKSYLKFDCLKDLDNSTNTYPNLFKFIEENMSETITDYTQSNFKLYEKFTSKLPKLKDFISVVSETFELDDYSEKSFDDTRFFVNIAPHIVTSPVLSIDSLKESINSDENHLEAEFDLLTPESNDFLDAFAKFTRIPPGMTSYNLANVPNYSSKDLKASDYLIDLNKTEKDFITTDLNSELYKNSRGQKKRYMFELLNDSENLRFTNIKTIEDLKRLYYLGPPVDVFALSEFLKIFNNPKHSFMLQPMVTYYYT